MRRAQVASLRSRRILGVDDLDTLRSFGAYLSTRFSTSRAAALQMYTILAQLTADSAALQLYLDVLFPGLRHASHIGGDVLKTAQFPIC